MKILKLFLLVTLFLTAGFESALKNQEKYLKPEEAFQVSAVESGDVIETKIVLGESIHVTDETLKYKITKPKEFELEVKRPTPHDSNGDMVHDKDIIIDIPIADITSKVSGDYTLMIEFQGCSDKGICYNTVQKEYSFEAQKMGFIDKILSLTDEANSANIVDVLKSESSFFVVLLFFVFGLLLALTPCIFPMIPILSSIIVSQSGSGKPSAAKGFFTSLIYVLAMAITYTLVGVISGVIGADIQSAMQNPWVLSSFALLFLALAFSLFGYYELQLPAKWQSKIHSASDSAQGKGILGTAIMGFLSAFIIGPCVAPPLAGAVIFISQTGDAFLGGLALFMMSMGMGIPLLLVGIGAGKFMPKPGGWMTRVSQVFGVVMLALSIGMLSKVLPESVTMLLWALLFIGIALYMGVFDSSSDSRGASKLFQLLSFVSLIYGSSLLIGYLSGSVSMLHPFEKFTTPTVVAGQPVVTQTPTHSAEDKSSHFGYSVERLLKEVEESDKPVVVDFTKKSCT
ncbi:MAG: protein-disulfide reductase DsbD, partial [Epsilonproteobacteria bacterium]|nr:protein-disulfide reductase DsbD [Campylobacterota bacterium]